MWKINGRSFISKHKKVLIRWLTLNSIWGRGWYHPPNRKRNKCNQVLPKSFWKTFKTIFEALSAVGACHLTIIVGWYTRSLWFSRFLELSQRVFDISSWNLFSSKILPSSYDKHQIFDYGCSRYPGNKAQSPDFGHFLTILGIFRAVCLGTSL